MRIARNMTLGDMNSVDDSENMEPQRAALGELKAKKKAPVNREGATKLGTINNS